MFTVSAVAYNLDTDNGRVGDGYMRQLQPIVGSVPYNGIPVSLKHTLLLKIQLHNKYNKRRATTRTRPTSRVYNVFTCSTQQ
jgi:hypothetical protein